jgi:uncharacterized membrane protein (DUF106 family)
MNNAEAIRQMRYSIEYMDAFNKAASEAETQDNMEMTAAAHQSRADGLEDQAKFFAQVATAIALTRIADVLETNTSDNYFNVSAHVEGS